MSGSGSLDELEIGEGCGGLIYVGTASSNRLYTTGANQGQNVWGPTGTSTGATGYDGMTNTDTLVALGSAYSAANICRAMGAKMVFTSRWRTNRGFE